MSVLLQSYFPIFCRLCLMFAVMHFGVLPLAAQTGTSAAAKPKVKLAPRPLPGMAPAGGTNTSSAPDIAATEAQSSARVPLFRPASVKPANSTQAGASATGSPELQSSERARILVVRRRGTFSIPKGTPREPTAIVNDTTMRPMSTEAVPVALPPGKIRVIPRESVKTGTPPPQP